MKTRANVQAAITKRLETHAGLDVRDLDITTTSLTFQKNLAYATVSIHPKGDPSVAKGMSMRYTLEARDGQWIVLEPVRSTGVNPHGATRESLPPGHPSLPSGSGDHDSRATPE